MPNPIRQDSNPVASESAGAEARLLLIDDDAELCELVSEYLQTRGFVVMVENDGAAGLARAVAESYALIVLDVMLPSMDGFEVLRRLRMERVTASLPVVMLTAHGDEVDRIVGLELGADDYLAKPFNPRELLARIRAVLRRAKSESPQQSAPDNFSPSETLVAGEVELDIGARSVKCAGESVELTALEFDLLQALVRAAGRVVSRGELARNVLERRLLPLDRSLDMHICKLRHKLWPQGDGTERIKTIRGVGYILGKS